MKRSFYHTCCLYWLLAPKTLTPKKTMMHRYITLNTPTNNQVYTSGQNIMITGQVTDNKFINQIHVVITNLGSGLEYLHVHIHPNSSSFNFSQSYTAQAGISYKIEVIADDASTNSSANQSRFSATKHNGSSVFLCCFHYFTMCANQKSTSITNSYPL